MNIRKLRTMVISPILLVLPMTCMHLGDDGHDGGHGGHHHSLQHLQDPIQDSIAKGRAGQKTGTDNLFFDDRDH